VRVEQRNRKQPSVSFEMDKGEKVR